MRNCQAHPGAVVTSPGPNEVRYPGTEHDGPVTYHGDFDAVYGRAAQQSSLSVRTKSTGAWTPGACRDRAGERGTGQIAQCALRRYFVGK